MCFIRKPSYFIKILSPPISRCRKTLRQNQFPWPGCDARIPPPPSTYLTQSYVSRSPHPPLHPADTWGTGQLQSGHSPGQGLALPVQTLCGSAPATGSQSCAISQTSICPHRGDGPVWGASEPPQPSQGLRQVEPCSHIPGTSGEGWCESRTLTFLFKSSQKQ